MLKEWGKGGRMMVFSMRWWSGREVEFVILPGTSG